MKIAIAGTGYVGLSLAVLLSQHNEVHALDIVPEKVEKINNYVSPIQDDEIERFLAEAKAGSASSTCTPRSTWPRHIRRRLRRHRHAYQLRIGQELLRHFLRRGRHRRRSLGEPGRWIVIKSTIPVGYTAGLRERLGDSKIFFSQSSCARARRSTTTCTPAASLWARRRRMPTPSLPPSASHACLPKERTQPSWSA